MKFFRHDERLFIILSAIGLLALFGMGGLNLKLGNSINGWIEIGVGAVGVVNLIWFGWQRNLRLASQVVLGTMLVLLLYLVGQGGIARTGWVWVFVYPALAFAIQSMKVASWYVSIFGLILAGLGVMEYQGYDYTAYTYGEMVQLCLAYMVVSLMGSMAERIHNRVEREYRKQEIELEKEKRRITEQAAELRIFKTAVEQSSEMMIFTDPEGVVLWANPATTIITGFTEEEAVGKKAGVLWGKLMEKEYYEQMWQTVKEEKRLFVGEIQNHRKNGEKFYSTITIYPLLDERGGVQYLVGTQRDITEQKEIDQMKTDFVSLVSHQLRTPLSAMRWNLEMLLGGDIGKLSAKQMQVIGQVEAANRRMIKLISTLLNISRIESGRLIVDPETVAIGEFLRELTRGMQSNVGGQKIALSLPEKEVKVKVDPMLLRQILNNFVNNASKYSPRDKAIKINLSVTGGQYSIAVEDKGYGIPAEEQRKIFGKFFRASNVTQHDTDGTGMGLYIGALVAKLLGGQIGFRSKVGQGSKFWVTLPIEGVSAKAGEVRLV